MAEDATLDCAASILSKVNEGHDFTLADDLCQNCQSVWNAAWSETDGIANAWLFARTIPMHKKAHRTGVPRIGVANATWDKLGRGHSRSQLLRLHDDIGW